jgi:hypothetical protein
MNVGNASKCSLNLDERGVFGVAGVLGILGQAETVELLSLSIVSAYGWMEWRDIWVGGM